MLAFYIRKKPGHELYSVISMIDHFFLEEILGNLIPIAFLVRFKIERVLFQNVSLDLKMNSPVNTFSEIGFCICHFYK